MRKSEKKMVLVIAAAIALTAHVMAINERPTEQPQRITTSKTYKDIQIIDISPKQPEEETETNVETDPPSIIPDYAAELIGRTIWGEAGGIKETEERAAVAWCILNRVDAWDKSIYEIVTAPAQFQGYRPEGECPQQHIDLAADVLKRWEAEKRGQTNVGRTLPEEYLFFIGDGKHNHFSTEFLSKDYWDWSLTDPYLR